jgi:hypothetical protein
VLEQSSGRAAQPRSRVPHRNAIPAAGWWPPRAAPEQTLTWFSLPGRWILVPSERLNSGTAE